MNAISNATSNATSTAIVEIDKAGRIVIPKKMRDALRIIPGTQLRIKQNHDELLLEPNFPEPHLERRNGLLVLVGGPPLSGEDVNRSVEEDRERRIRNVSGLSDEP